MTANSALREKLDEMVNRSILEGDVENDLEAVALSLLAEKEELKAKLDAAHDGIRRTNKNAEEHERMFYLEQQRAEKAEAQVAMLRPLAEFGLACFEDHRNAGEPCDLDGGWLQEQAERHELIEPREMDKPCGDDCACAAICDFPTTCYWETATLKAGREALSSTAPAAQEWEARIRKETLEAFCREMPNVIYPSANGGMRSGAFKDYHIKAIREHMDRAIMGSEGFDGPDVQSRKEIDGPTSQSHRGEG